MNPQSNKTTKEESIIIDEKCDKIFGIDDDIRGDSGDIYKPSHDVNPQTELEKQIDKTIQSSALGEVLEYYRMSRQVGHTTAMLNGALASNSLVIAANETHKRNLMQSGVARDLITTPSVMRYQLRSGRSPLLIDHYTLDVLVNMLRGELISTLSTLTAKADREGRIAENEMMQECMFKDQDIYKYSRRRIKELQKEGV